MKVLVIDDQYINRYLLEKLLSGYGFEVITAEDGMKALELVHLHSFDLIISDILLPKMDGFQLCKAIKSDPSYQMIPFVFYTAAYTDQKDQEFAESLGADRFILKPTDPDEFISIIRKLFAEKPALSDINPKPMILKEDEYLSEHNRSLFHQLEKKLNELDRLNKELRLSEERYRNLFENAQDAIILHEVTSSDGMGQIREVNRFACISLEYLKEELTGMKISAIYTQKFQEKCNELFSLLAVSGHLTFEGELLTRSGRIIPAEISAHLYYEDEVRYCLAICRDITVRKETMREMSEAIVQINKNIHQLATIGDEIRNPLAIILSLCDSLCLEDSGKQQIVSEIRTIDEFISRLDQGWVESDKIRAFLLKHYDIFIDE